MLEIHVISYGGVVTRQQYDERLDRVPVNAMPAVRMLCAVGMYMFGRSLREVWFGADGVVCNGGCEE